MKENQTREACKEVNKNTEACKQTANENKQIINHESLKTEQESNRSLNNKQKQQNR